MLDTAKVYQALQRIKDDLYKDTTNNNRLIMQLWQEVLKDPFFETKAAGYRSALSVPTWVESLDTRSVIVRKKDSYSVVAVDGSQIYPDRHQHGSCYLINTGTVVLKYDGKASSAAFSNEPALFADYDELMEHATDLVNAQRQDLELQACVRVGKKVLEEQGTTPYVLVDGSLIFWHLHTKDVRLKNRFLPRYIDYLQELYALRIPIAGYISLPHSKEMMTIIRVADAVYYQQKYKDELQRCVDSVLMRMWLQENERSVVCASSSPIVAEYPEHLKPHCMYIKTPYEVARIEIPQWMTQNKMLIETVGGIILDQAEKGFGYPVALAEAHEQAVVKGADRELFYHLLQKIGIQEGRYSLLSEKHKKKRVMSV